MTLSISCIHSYFSYSKDGFVFPTQFGVRRCWRITAIFSFHAVPYNSIIKGFWCILMPKEIDVGMARTGRKKEQLSLNQPHSFQKPLLRYLMEYYVPKVFSSRLSSKNFSAQEVWAEMWNNDPHNILLWPASLETLFLSEMKDALKPAWIWGACGSSTVFITLSLGVIKRRITENSKETNI